MTIFLVIVISLVSVIAFRYKNQWHRFDLSPYRIIKYREYYRLITHAFLHVDYVHLIVNMIVLYSFGRSVEMIFRQLQLNDYIDSAYLSLSLLIVFGIIASTIVTILKNKDKPEYAAVGASGLVSAMVFTHIFFQPMQKIYFYFAIPVPGILFGILYLVYSSYMGRRNKDNINHDAHLWGAVFGFIYPLIISPELIKFFLDNFF